MLLTMIFPKFHYFHNLILLKISIPIISQFFLINYFIKIIIKYYLIFLNHQLLLISYSINLNLLTIIDLIIKGKLMLLNYCLILEFLLFRAILRFLINYYRIDLFFVKILVRINLGFNLLDYC